MCSSFCLENLASINTEFPASHCITHTICCIVGGGPAGMVLALLLARRGVPVTLLEAHNDFDRQFRGNTISPATMHVLDQLGLFEHVSCLRHTKVRRFVVQTASGALCFADFSHLHTRYPFVMMLPQQQFLATLASELRRYPHAHLVMNARVQELVTENGVVRGARYQGMDGWHDVRADLVVGADGRFSRMRKLAGLTPVATASPLDVLWFNVPRCPDDPDDVGTLFRFVPGGLLVFMDHTDYWQVGYIIAKGGFAGLRAAGLAALRNSLSAQLPAFAARFAQLHDWKQLSLLSVESSRARR